MFRVFITALLTISLFSCLSAQAVLADNDVVKIGVLAKRGPELCLEKWSLTGEYLSHKIPGKKFEILPLDFDQVFSAVEKGEVDFILVNPSIYVELESRFRVNRIATLKNKVKDAVSTEFGGVIVLKKQREDILQLKDLKGKAVIAVSEKSFGGFIMAWLELKQAGIDPFKDFTSLGFAGTHDAVVYAVKDGKADAGIVRTDTLESMAFEGRIKLEDFKVLHEHGGDKVHLPFVHSTRSYPEWPLAKLAHTSDSLAEKVTIALLEMPGDSQAALASKIAGWTIPSNYQTVHETLKFLKIGPYKDFGKITSLDIFKKYWLLILINIATLIILAWFLISHIRLNQKLKTVQEKLLFEIHGHEVSQGHVQRLNLVLRNIRSVNNLIVTKNDPQDLVQSICDVLVKNKGFLNAWIALKDAKKGFTMVEAGLGHDFSLLQDRVKNQGLAHCGQKVLDQPGLQVVEDPVTTCTQCPIASKYEGRSAMRIRLEHGNKVFGLLTVSVSKQIVLDKEEQALFEELAADISLGLNNLANEQEHNLAVRALMKSEAFNKSIIASSNDCIKILDLDARLEFMSAAGQKLMEIEDIGPYLNQSWADFWKGSDHKAALDAISKAKDGRKGQFQGFCPTEKGIEKWWDIMITPIYDEYGKIKQLLAVSRDITSQRSIEAQLRQAQKMESVGRLAGGVAHDYNNALTVIMGFTELAMMDADPTGPLNADLNQVLKAGRRAQDITRQLLAFARKQTIAPIALNLNQTVESMIKMLQRLIGEDIDLVWLPGKNLWNVKMDPSQIDQILANLCVNARDAIDGVGKITIETDKVVLDKDYCADHVGFIPGKFALLAVSDNGCGMDKEVLKKIFEPFFTTKDVDKGTGLGLATVYGIVKQNNGFINVYSEPGKGTTIKIYLPRHEGKAVEIQGKNTEKVPQGCEETILVVEDDLSILKLAQKILKGLNYTVLIADTPKGAMRLAKEHANEIHLLITDVVMPEMNGRELSEHLQSLFPDLKCIFMSGYTANAIAHHGVLDKGVHFIQKPFSKRDLATFVRNVLDA